MSVGILGKKVGMTQVYGDDGVIVPVTVIEAGPCVVLQVRTPERDGYSAVQLGFDDLPRRKAIRSVRGHVAALGGRRADQRKTVGWRHLRRQSVSPSGLFVSSVVQTHRTVVGGAAGDCVFI